MEPQTKIQPTPENTSEVPDNPSAQLNALIEETGGNSVEQQAQFDEIAAKTRKEITDPYEQTLFDLTTDAVKWFHWGKQGDPLPAGLCLRRDERDVPVVTFAFPLDKETEKEMRRRLFDHGYNDLIKEIDIGHSQNYKERVKPAAVEFMMNTQGATLSRVIAAGGDILPDEEPDTREDPMQFNNARQHAKERTGVDPFSSTAAKESLDFSDPKRSRLGVAAVREALGFPKPKNPKLDATFFGRREQARREFHRHMLTAEPPTKKVDKDILTPEHFVAARGNLLNWIDTVDPEVGNLIRFAEFRLGATNVHVDQFKIKKRVTERLRQLFQEQVDTPVHAAAGQELFVSFCYDALWGQNEQGRNARYLAQRYPTWEAYFKDMAEEEVSRADLDYSYGTHGIRTSQGRELDLPDAPKLLTALREPDAPIPESIYAESASIPEPSMFLVDADPSIPNVLTDGELPTSMDTINFLTKAESEKKEATMLGFTIETGKKLPPGRRLITQRVMTEVEQHLPDTDDTADMAILIKDSGFVSDGSVPHIPGFTLTAFDKAAGRYHFSHTPDDDPYSHKQNIWLTDEHRAAVVAAARELGMHGMADYIEPREKLSARGLAKVIQAFSFHGFPGEDVLPEGKRLIAKIENLGDIKQFISPDGRFCGQCTGGEKLFGFMMAEGMDTSRISSIGGYTWEPYSSVLTASKHRQSKIRLEDGSYAIFDVSLSPDENAEFIQIPDKTPEGIAAAEAKKKAQTIGSIAGNLIEREKSETEQDSADDLLLKLQQQLGGQVNNNPHSSDLFLDKIVRLHDEDPLRQVVSLVYRLRTYEHSGGKESAANEALGIEIGLEVAKLESFLESIQNNARSEEGREHLRHLSATGPIPLSRYAESGVISMAQDTVRRVQKML